MSEFFVLNLRTQLPMRNAQDETILYASGEEAAAAAAAFSDATGNKCQPRLFKLDENWQKREQLKLLNRVNEPLPWDAFALEGYAEWYQADYPARFRPITLYPVYSSQLRHNWFYYSRKPEAKYNFPHVSKIRKGNIAFTESADRGQRNIQTSIKPGRYFERFYNDLGRGELRRIANDFVMRYGETKLLFASTKEDLAMVFAHDFGPNSCMTYELDDYVTGFSPVRAYAGSDLQVAYIAVCDDEGKPYSVSARCVVWPEKKRYGRIYGEDQKIVPLLKAHGFTSGRFAGAKLPKIEFEPGEYVMPYLDGDCDVIDKGDHWVIAREGDGDYKALSTNGVIETEKQCCRCGEMRDNRNWTRVYNTGERWCQSCIENHTYECQRCCRRYSEDFDSYEIKPHNKMWCHYCMEEAAGMCVKTETYWRYHDLIEIGYVWWSREYFRDHGAHCNVCGRNVPKEDYEHCQKEENVGACEFNPF